MIDASLNTDDPAWGSAYSGDDGHHGTISDRRQIARSLSTIAAPLPAITGGGALVCSRVTIRGRCCSAEPLNPGEVTPCVDS